MTNNKKRFELGTILTITTGRMYTSWNKYNKILAYLTGVEGLCTHQLGRAREYSRLYILSLYPELNGVAQDADIEDWDDVKEMVDELSKTYGKTKLLSPIPENFGYVKMDPYLELESMGFKYETEGRIGDTDFVAMVRDDDDLGDDGIEIVRRKK